MFRAQIDEASIKIIRDAVNTGVALGGERFKNEIELALGRSIRPKERGCPREARGEFISFGRPIDQ